jgi:hypothetical protein
MIPTLEERLVEGDEKEAVAIAEKVSFPGEFS